MTEFIHRLQVRYNECDPQGIVFNANYLLYVDVALTQMWTTHHAALPPLAAQLNIDTVVGGTTLEYRAPAYPGDELDVGLTLSHIGTTSLTYDIHIRRGDTTITTGNIRYVCIDQTTKQKTPIPDALRELLTAT